MKKEVIMKLLYTLAIAVIAAGIYMVIAPASSKDGGNAASSGSDPVNIPN